MEVKVKKREWVKNAAIIFLAIMLVLTFFSNTIMNRSLPEVATKPVTSGEITAKIRGTGAVTANESYEVSLAQTREIEAVKVKEGDEVKVGDVLFVLSAAASDEVAAAEDALDAAQMAYQQALVEGSKTSTDTAIARAREALEDAKIEFASMSKVTAQDVASAKTDYDAKLAVTRVKEIDKNKAEAALEAAGGWTPPSGGGGGDYSSVQAAQTALTEARNNLGAAQIKYQAMYAVFEDIAQIRYKNDTTHTIDSHRKALYADYSIAAVKDEYPGAEDGGSQQYTKGQLAEAYKAISDATAKVTEKEQAYNSAVNIYNNSNASTGGGNYSLKQAYDKANNAYETAKLDSDTANAVYTGLKETKTAYDAAKQAVYAKEDELSKAMSNVQLSSLDLNQKSRAVARASEKLNELRQDATETEIKSKVDGVVKSVSAVAGKSYDGGTTLANITLPDQGYIVSYTVTTEQSRKVHSGDEATITNYWGGNLTATLQSIKPDPQDPQNKKILTFNIQGEVSEGTSLTISVGQKSAQYDAIVPNSAIRSDSNGDFVLMVTSKSTPLATRYKATRVDIEKLASDDTNTAVSGAISAYDYVITTSTKPINTGDMVKLADS